VCPNKGHKQVVLSTFDRIARSVRAFSRELSRPPASHPKVEFVQPHRLKLGVALGGGFARGLVHIGVLKALDEAAIPVDFVAGTSVGAIIGACYCAGMNAADLEEVARATRFKHFARWTLSRYGLCSNDRMTAFCARVLRVTAFEDLKIPLAVTATDFQTGEAAVFTTGPLVAPIRASCAYPGMFHPVEIDGRSYIDGMLAYAVPTTPLRIMGAERVLGIYLSAHWTQHRPPRHLFEVVGQCFSIAQARMSDVWKRDADLVLEPDVNGFSYDCFDRAKELIALGQASVHTAVPEIRRILNIPEPGVNLASAPAPVTHATVEPSVAV
jgi:NTE family protein